MDSEQLRALADTVNSIYAETYTQREAIERVVAYLRAQADAEPVAAGWKWVPVEPTQAMNNAGLSAVNQYGKRSVWETYAAMLAAAPAAPQAELDDDDALVLGEPDMLTPEDVRRLVPQAEPKRGLTCLWSRADDDTDTWETACRHAFTIIEGTPTDNSMAFCCYCGRTLEQEIGGSDER